VRTPPYAVYILVDFTNVAAGEYPCELNHKYAIAVLIDQDDRTSKAYTGSDWISNSMSMMSYATSGFIAIILADYIRRLGYPAKAHYAPFYDVVLPPILLWAGLGEMSRIGDSVLHPFLGPRFKGAVVTTDLPLQPDKPIDFGLQDFCSKCKKCARECPSGQSVTGQGDVQQVREVAVNVEVHGHACGQSAGSGCGTCLKVCLGKPYTPFHRAVNWTMRHSAWPGASPSGDDLLGYENPTTATSGGSTSRMLRVTVSQVPAIEGEFETVNEMAVAFKTTTQPPAGCPRPRRSAVDRGAGTREYQLQSSRVAESCRRTPACGAQLYE
jgi:reductive dehalogenase